jgi:peptidoglycan hydrolase-like protein with peptidoglycan-binding domain
MHEAVSYGYMKKYILAVAALLSGIMPALVHADTNGLTSEQVNSVIQLLQSFGADQEVLSNVESSLTGAEPSSGGAGPGSASMPNTAPVAAPAAVSSGPAMMPAYGSPAVPVNPVSASVPATQVASSMECVTLEKNLQVNATDTTTGGEVSKLQKFLGGRITGFYGPATQKLVQDWQANHAVVSAGSPSVTGYGSVGPKTRQALMCGNTAIGAGKPMMPPQNAGPGTVVAPRPAMATTTMIVPMTPAPASNSAAVGAAAPALLVTGSTGEQVSFKFSNMPPTRISIRDSKGLQVWIQDLIPGTGSTSVTIPVSVPTGSYTLAAIAPDGSTVATSSAFTLTKVAEPTGGGGGY